MPSYIVKPKPDEDYYVRYSTIVDAPTAAGTRADWLARGEDPARLDRADASGSSALWPSTQRPAYGWHETEISVREGWPTAPPEGTCFTLVSRSDLRILFETLGDDGYWHPPAGIVTWTDENGQPIHENEKHPAPICPECRDTKHAACAEIALAADDSIVDCECGCAA